MSCRASRTQRDAELTAIDFRPARLQLVLDFADSLRREPARATRTAAR